MPKNVITEALKSFCATLNFIEIQIKLLDENYDARNLAYITIMKQMFKQISTTMTKSLSPKQSVQAIMSEIGGGW